MLAHRLPWRERAATMTASSHAEKASLVTCGLSWQGGRGGVGVCGLVFLFCAPTTHLLSLPTLTWLHHRSRHDLPDRPLMPAAMRDQFLGP